jgi:L-fuconolactonase
VKEALTVDAHQHFWDPGRADYPWLTDALAPIRRSFGPKDLRPALAERGIDRTVLVQTRSSLEETREFLAVAASTDFVAGVVGWADLTDPDVPASLESLRLGLGGTRLVGLRHQVHDEVDPRWLLRDDVRRGFRAVEEAGLVYDFLVRTRELPAAAATARDFPTIRFVIDHAGKPPIRTGQIEDWAAAMAPFARLQNVACKLSGMITEADWTAWRPDDLVPYVRRAVEWFGDDRLMFGSDWPVCLVAGSYAQVFDALQFALGGCSDEARAKIFGANAARVYRLESGSR